MTPPKTLADLNALVRNQVPEDLHLDYKQSGVFGKPVDDVKRDLAKDASAFGNSDGGVLVFGVVEKNQVPVKVDSGVDDKVWSRERIESILHANIAPRIDGLMIYPIRVSSGRSAYSIEVPKSFRGPHQDRMSRNYYKRFNFMSVSMEHYEIEDVRNRRDVVLPLISVDAEIRHGVLMHLIIRNIADIPAEDASFAVVPEVPGLTTGQYIPNILTRGARFIPPGREYRLFFGSAIEAANNPPRFDVAVTYFNRRLGRQITDNFHVDMGDYLNSAIVESDITEEGTRVAEALGKLTEKLNQIQATLTAISTVAGPTGLDLSATSLRNLKRLRDSEPGLERIPARAVDWRGFAEVVGIDSRLAMHVAHFASWPKGRLEDISGMTPEAADRLRRAFIFDDE